MTHRHYWQILEVEKWSPDRFHIYYQCEQCGMKGTTAHGIAGKHGQPYVIDKLVPGPEIHWLVGPA